MRHRAGGCRQQRRSGSFSIRAHSRLPHAKEQKMNETTVQLTFITLAIITQAIVLLQAACILLL